MDVEPGQHETVRIGFQRVALALAPTVFAQNRTDGELGVFFNYTRLAHSSTNFYGIGGRVGFNVHPQRSA